MSVVINSKSIIPNTMDPKKYLEYWKELYKEDLLNDIMPFWLEHGLDRVNGGVYTCLTREGEIMDTTKSVWFQGRFGFTTAFAYNNVEKNPAFLEASKSCIDFIEAHCFDTDGHMYFEVMADGTPLRKRRYVFSEGFAAIAMSEYSIATGDKHYAERALEIFKSIIRMLETPGFLEAKYLDTMKSQGHSITMILVNTASRIRAAINDPILSERIDISIKKLRQYFMHPEFEALLECVGPEGEFIDNINGRLINPGHCIETAWFIMEEARHRNNKEMLDMALTILDWSWKWGWDDEFGGIINFRDCKGYPQQDYSQDMKFWWPQTEAIIATLYAYEATGDEKYLKMHRQISDWTYAHFPDREYGEWYGYLHRDGSVAQTAKGNIFKGPFHIARMMTQCYILCSRMLSE